MAAPETEDKDILWLGEGPKPEKRKKWLRHRGCPFFCLLFFARAKKSRLPWVNHPQLQIYYLDKARGARSTNGKQKR